MSKYFGLYSFSTVVAFLLLAMCGCKAPSHLARKPSVQLPSQYGVVSDSGNIADIPWHSVFTDDALQKLIDTALKSNIDLQVALQRIEIARADYSQTLGPLRPSVDAVVTGGAERISPNSINRLNNPGSSINTDIFIGLRSSWEIDLWRKLRNTRKASYNRYLAMGEELHLMKTILVAEVSKLYYSLLALDKELEIVQRNIDLQRSIVNIITIQKEGGRATSLAVQQSRAQLLNTEALAVHYQQRIIEAENDLNLLLGRLPKDILRSDSFPEKSVWIGKQIGVPVEILSRRPDVQAAELRLEAIEADVEAARATFLPALIISPYAGFNALSPLKIFDPSSIAVGIIGGLTAPVFNRIAIQSNYDRTVATNQQAYLDYQQAIISSYTEVYNSLNQIRTYNSRINLMEEETGLLKEAVDISKDLYLAGYATYLEVIVAQENVLTAELNLVDTKKDLYMAQIDLYRSLGGGWK